METKKKKYMFFGVVMIFIMLISGYGLVSAWGPGSKFKMGFNHGFHGRGPHSGFHNKDIAEFLLWKLDKRVKKLDLTEDQKEKYNELRSNIEKHFMEGVGDRKSLKKELHEEINKEDPDIRMMAESMKRKIHEISGFLEKNLDLLVEFYESLDSTQKERVLDAIRDRMAFHRM